ncbi:hypothetical protein Dimus_001731, partial [Dionaea muscipula]
DAFKALAVTASSELDKDPRFAHDDAADHDAAKSELDKEPSLAHVHAADHDGAHHVDLAADDAKHFESKYDDVDGMRETRPVRSRMLSQLLRSPYLNVRMMEKEARKSEIQLFANFKRSKKS